jgi:hypothetical protein
MFDSKNIYHYLLAFSVIFISSYFANKIKNSFPNNDEYDLIKKYLLNDSPLYGFNRPKLWIHTTYEVNSRKWKSFYSRNSVDLNQPYIHLTIKTIINHCGDDFNICLIDDETFSKLIPSWDIDLKTVAEPMKSEIRQIGILKLIYYYGGMAIPNSFLCIKNLKPLYDECVSTKKAFVFEGINHSMNLLKQTNALLFTPNLYFCGALKNDETIKELIEYLKNRNQSHHFTNESDFLGETSAWCLDAIVKDKMVLMGGEYIGIKTNKRTPILLDDLMSEDFLDVSCGLYGIYIPEDEILTRKKYQWFAVMDSESILKSNMIISKYLKASIVNSVSEYSKPTEIKSVVSI